MTASYIIHKVTCIYRERKGEEEKRRGRERERGGGSVCVCVCVTCLDELMSIAILDDI